MGRQTGRNVRTSTAVAIGVTVVLLLGSPLAVGAATSPAVPTIKLKPSVGPPTTLVIVHGSRFGSSETVEVSFGRKLEATVMTDSDGRFRASFDVPKGAHPGGHAVKAKGPAHEVAKATFLVRTDWPQFRFDHIHSGTNPYENVLSAANVHRLTMRWSFEMALDSSSSAAVVGGVVYIGSNGSDVYALDATTGVQLWHYVSGGTAERGPAVANGIVYAPCTTGVDALDTSDGHRLWHFSAFDPRPVNVSDGVVYFGSYQGSLYAVDAVTGVKKWSYPTGPIASSPAVADGVVYVGSEDHHVYAVDASTGTKLWIFTTGDKVHSSPAIAGGIVYIGSNDGFVYALEASTGEKVWSFMSAGGIVDSSPSVSGGVVYVGADRDIYALNAATGAMIWAFPNPVNALSSPAVANDVVYIGTVVGQKNAIVALDSVKGNLLWSYEPGGYLDSSPTVVDGKVYFASGDSNVYAFGL
jgi:outer membrane protein assembly factor BamB